MQYIIRLIVLLIVLMGPAQANDVDGDLNTNMGDHNNNDSNNTTTNNNYNATGAGSAAPVMSAIAPTVMGGGGNDSCLIPTSTGMSLSIMGLSSGTVEQDEQCNRRKNARLLGLPQNVGGLGLQVSSISLLCGDVTGTIFKAMALANTYCPITDIVSGKLLMGLAALDKYRENPAIYVVGYELNKEFWDAYLRVGEDLTLERDALKNEKNTNTNTVSLSDRFRSSKRRDNRRSEDSKSD